MKGKKIITISIIINLILVGIVYNLIGKVNVNNKKQVIKEMSETEYEDYITSLNTSHEEYANYIEESKKQIASAITEMGVSTSDEETLETMANNIKSIAKSNTIRNEILYEDITFEATNSSYSSYITKSNGTIYYSYGSGNWTGIQAELDLTDVKYVIYACGHGWSGYAKNGLSSTKPSSSITDVSGMTFTKKEVNKLHILDVTELTGTYYFYAVGKNYVAIGDTDATFSLNYFGLIKDNLSVSNFHLEGVLQ